MIELLHAGNLGAVAPPDSSLANRSTFLGVEITTAPEDAGWLFGGAVSRLRFGAAFLASLLSVPLLPGSFPVELCQESRGGGGPPAVPSLPRLPTEPGGVAAADGGTGGIVEAVAAIPVGLNIFQVFVRFCWTKDFRDRKSVV